SPIVSRLWVKCANDQSCESPNGSEGKERVKPVMLSTDTPASIVAVPYSTLFTTVITGTSAVGLGDSIHELHIKKNL
ncbi:hypothetical protein PIB30_068346, partial [Stylosanthes scabra]|nr:hypothetical protein [Stylosanthes scabra]